MMYDKETRKKIASCQALQGVSVAEIVGNRHFLDNLAGYLLEQREERETARASFAALKKAGGARGRKLPSHVCDKFIHMTAEQFASLYLDVIAGRYDGPFAERRYIRQLGMQAYNLTVAQIICDEFPELEPILIPKA